MTFRKPSVPVTTPVVGPSTNGVVWEGFGSEDGPEFPPYEADDTCDACKQIVGMHRWIDGGCPGTDRANPASYCTLTRSEETT